MMTCIFLAWLANCSDDPETLRMHAMYGCRAMQEWEEVDFDNSSIGRALFYGVSDLSFRIQAYEKPALFLQDDQPILLHAATCTMADNLSHAEYLVNRYCDVWSELMLPPLPHGFSAGDVNDDSDSTLHTWRVSMMFRARIWERQLKMWYAQLVMAPQSLHDLLTLTRLWDQAVCAKISAAVAAEEDPVHKPLQMRYDVLWPYFRRINELGKKLLQSLIREGVSKPVFPIDQAVATPLFFCGQRCRDWSIRREALHLLRAWGERFKGTTLPTKVSALERIIDIESRGLQPGSVVPEPARIHFVEVVGDSSNMDFSYLQLGMSRVIDEVQ